MNKVDDTLKDRQGKHGDFGDNAKLAQGIKELIRCSQKGAPKPDIVCEALDMIVTKISRICTGNYMYDDHWHDIQGYTKIVENWVKENQLFNKADKTCEEIGNPRR